MLRKSILGLFGATIFLSLAVSARAQDLRTINIKIEDFPLAYQNKEPVKIIGLYHGTTLIASGEDFQADKDWLRDLRVMVKNVSDQPIREIILILDMKTDHPDYEARRIDLHYGPGYWYTREPAANEQEPMLAPGALVTLSYNSNNKRAYEWMRSQLANDRNGQISLDSVVFEDIDKGWHGTKYVMRTATGWTGDPDKKHLNGGPQRAN